MVLRGVVDGAIVFVCAGLRRALWVSCPLGTGSASSMVWGVFSVFFFVLIEQSTRFVVAVSGHEGTTGRQASSIQTSEPSDSLDSSLNVSLQLWVNSVHVRLDSNLQLSDGSQQPNACTAGKTISLTRQHTYISSSDSRNIQATTVAHASSYNNCHGRRTQAVFVDELGADPSCLSNATPKDDFGGGHADPNLTYAKDLVKAMGLTSKGAKDPEMEGKKVCSCLW